ncbi:hypothetical protein EDB92DRAFT_376200 [Lactarius akahatsu]|uniref:Uncharacterized protein n=1 Tax=Lactarius akahatsu TaxID=416441 RepID=A0AAD4Q950_9AGAM|nr:hypothetical protein EDB92DRAFT_376200 [Lactarius akahatsu]
MFSPNAFYDQYKLTVYDNLVVGIVYGAYVVLYVASVHILLGKPGFSSSRSKMVMFGITTFTFVLGIISLVLQTALEFQQTWWLLDHTAANVWPLGRIGAVSIVVETIRRLMYILSDIICAWRAVVLWNRDKHVTALLLFLVLGTTAAVGCELGLSLIPILSPPYVSIPIIADDFGPLLVVFPILGTNLVSTALIAMKAWQYRVSIKKHLGKGTGSVRVDRVFALLIESGFVYCCLWILYVILTFNLNTTIMHNALLFVSGLYPTLIVILVAMQKSPVEDYSTYSTGIQFASAPALAPPSAGNTPSFVYTVYHEHTNDSDERVPSAALMTTSGEETNR